MTVMHDASGCNSTYTTHDEPRWYSMDSMVYISALSELEAVMGTMKAGAGYRGHAALNLVRHLYALGEPLFP